MTVRAWRLVLVTFCAACFVVNGISLLSDGIEASSALGFQVARTSNGAFVRVNSVDAGGAAATSGLRVGDRIDIRALSPANRYRLITGVHPYERITIAVVRGSNTVHVLYRADGKPPWRWDVWVYCAASLWLLGFAFLIAWRRADSAEARILCVILAGLPGGSAIMAGSWLTASPLADMIAACIGYAIMWVTTAMLASYALLFGRPPSLARRALTALTYALALGIVADEALRLVWLWTGREAWVAQTLGPDWNYGWGALPYFAALLCAFAAIGAARGAERSRVAWTTATLGIMYVLSALEFAVPMILPVDERGTALVLAYQLINVGSFLAPLGMTYALLNRRLLDIGFALNRATIFAGVSIVLVGIFVLVEWLLSDWLQGASHSANLAITGALALVLGFSIRFVHGRVEHVVDNVFFRKRRQDEEAIRRMAAEAPYVTERYVLLARTEAVLSKHADAAFAAVLLDDGQGTYGGVGENDPALVALRAHHERIDVHAFETSVEGEYAYPMVARGRLVGALVLGPKRSGEAYAPDESQAIAQLAHSVAGALDVLAAKQETGLGDILDGMAALGEDLKRLPQRFAEILEKQKGLVP